MIIACPKCSTRYRISEDKLSGDSLKLKCRKCGKIFLLKKKVPAKKEVPGLPVMAAGKKILIAHSSSSIREMIGELLKGAGFLPLYAKNGVEALSVMADMHPEVVVVDVALQDIFGFEFPEIIKKDKRLEDIKVILIASIYDQTRYKRLPQSLYGADDFIEKHRIRDSLVPKINSLLGNQEEIKVTPKQAAAVQVGIGVKGIVAPKVAAEDARKLKEEELVHTTADTQDIEKAKRLARIIISDIALYNQELLEKGIRQGNIEEELKNDLEEGRRLFIKRVPEYIRQKADYLTESMNELIAKKKKEFGVA